MKQNVNPGVAIGLIIAAIGVAAFLLWFGNREKPRPEHFGLPPMLQQMEDKRSAGFAKKTEDIKKGIIPGKDKPADGIKPEIKPGDSKDGKSTEAAKPESKPAETK